MQVRPVFTPGKTLKQTFCKSRPLDNNKCVLGNPERCTICPTISNGTCGTRGAVYQITCGLCNSDTKYQGETDRPLHHRLKEHVRAAANLTAYPDNTLGQHYAGLHNNCNAMLHVYILDMQQKTSRRKLSEALFIHKNKPTRVVGWAALSLMFDLGARILIGWLVNTLRKPPSRSACLGDGCFVFALCWVTCYPRDEYNINCLYIIIIR